MKRCKKEQVTASRRFTLVELLIVMVIILILAALMMPVANRAREQAHFVRWKGWTRARALDTDCLGYWTMEAGSGNSVANWAPGDPKNNLTQRKSGEINGATWLSGPTGNSRWSVKPTLEFDGVDDYVDVGENYDLYEKSFTLAAWCRRNGFNNYMYLFGHGNTCGSKQMHFGYHTDNRLTMRFCSNDMDGSDKYTNYDMHFVAYVYDTDTNTRTIYYNAALEKTGTTGTDYRGAMSSSLLLGIPTWFNGGGGNDWWNGTIDEAAVFNRALSQEELYEIYEIGQPLGGL